MVDATSNYSDAAVENRSAPAGPDSNGAPEHHPAGSRTEWIRVGFVALVLLVVWSGVAPKAAGIDWLALTGIAIGGYPIFREAISDLLKGRMTMELSMTIALAAAAGIGEFFTALLITLFVLIAELIEGMTVGRGRRAIGKLLDRLPHTAEVRADGVVAPRDLSQVQPGDVVVVRPGGHIPVDGIVVTGSSFVDQASITGESLPIEKSPGAKVFAGTINHSGVLEINAEKVGRDTAFGRIIEAVERAENSRAPIQRLADRLAGYLVYFALACAALTFFVTRDARSTISVIVVAGACGIAAGTPLAILGAIGRAARLGAIIKGGLYLELLGSVDTVVLDKTGTLTSGVPEIADVRAFEGANARDIVGIAATAERFSEHPLARAITRRASELGLPVREPEAFRYLPGKGIVCEVEGVHTAVGTRALMEVEGVLIPIEASSSQSFSEVMVAQYGRVIGAIRIVDILRPEAAAAIREIRAMGCRTVMLTGDRKEVGEAIAMVLGVDEVESDLLPDAKVRCIRKLRTRGFKVAMVGDGVNDAPALLEATVGIAMGSGTDVARESASVVLLGNDLLRFAEVLKLARRCRRIIMANFAGTLAVDAVGVALAAMGFLNPVWAALIHVSSELLFIMNSARLLPSFDSDRKGRG